MSRDASCTTPPKRQGNRTKSIQVHMKKDILLLSFALFFYVVETAAQFHLNGSALQVSDSCWALTPDELQKAGSIWNLNKVNLNNSFQVIMELYFGCRDGDGADGILFGLQPLSTSIGQQGEGLGFQGVSPSIGIEFDTWQNGNLNDPAFDHIAIHKNGNLNHNSSSSLAGPVQAHPMQSNIEDCTWHKLRVNWNAQTHTIEVWFDCQLRLRYVGDLVHEVFGGNPHVFWGFTAATGAARNLQQVCYSYTTFLDGFKDVVICPGGQFQLKLSGGVKYHWSPATGLSNPNIANPIAAPTETTTYLVEVTDACNHLFFDSLTVFVDGDTVFFDLGADTLLCEGQQMLLDATSLGADTVTYHWSTGQTTPTLEVLQTGHYAVTVTVDEYCVADDRISVKVLSPPRINLPSDTTLCLKQELSLDVSAGVEQIYQWQDGTQGPLFRITSPGSYVVRAFNPCGSVEQSFEVYFENCRQVYFPSVFSPNGDGINDLFLPFDGGDVVRVLVFKIFDRWGNLVFETGGFRPANFLGGWDGRFKGQQAAQGVYAWLAEVEFRDGVVNLLSGDVLLIR